MEVQSGAGPMMGWLLREACGKCEKKPKKCYWKCKTDISRTGDQMLHLITDGFFDRVNLG